MEERKENLRENLASKTEEVRQNSGQQPKQKNITDVNKQTSQPGSAKPEEGSGVSTKRNLTGSDYDGQVTP